jgi:hypothetical protein
MSAPVPDRNALRQLVKEQAEAMRLALKAGANVYQIGLDQEDAANALFTQFPEHQAALRAIWEQEHAAFASAVMDEARALNLKALEIEAETARLIAAESAARLAAAENQVAQRFAEIHAQAEVESKAGTFVVALMAGLLFFAFLWFTRK